MRCTTRSIAGLLLLIVAVIVAPCSQAQTTYTWTGPLSGNWGTAGNWNPAVVPGDQDKARFGIATNKAIDVSNGADGYEIDSLDFLSNASSYTLHVGGTDGGLFINSGIVNQSAHHPAFTVDANSFLGIYGGDLADSMITNSGEVVFSGSVLSAGSANLINQSGGLINFNVGGSFTAAAATIVNNAGATVDVGSANIPGVSIGSLSGAGDVRLGSHTLSLAGLNSNDTISGVLSDSGGLTKTGAGTLTLSGANTYTGATTIESGTLQVDGSLSPSSAVEVSPYGLSTLGGAGSVGHVGMDIGAVLKPGNADPNTSLTMNSLSCDSESGGYVYSRIGNNGSSTYGTFLILQSPLTQANCAGLRLFFYSAGKPLAVSQAYLVAIIDGATDYTSGNLDYDFFSFPGYTQASGHFLVYSTPTFSDIFFVLDDPGNEIFKNGFE